VSSLANGYFVTFEGGEGVGKTSQLQFFEKRLKASSLVPEEKILFLREPGGTKIGEVIRSILLGLEYTEMVDYAEIMLFEAARVQIVEERIKPVLERGGIVVCDRFYDSTEAYQGYARGLNLQDVRQLNRIAAQGCHPDTTFLLSLDAEVALARATIGGADRMEQEDINFHVRVHQGYLNIAADNPERVVPIDASGTIDEIADTIWQIFENRYKEAQVGR
jgi:dTMP kinase